MTTFNMIASYCPHHVLLSPYDERALSRWRVACRFRHNFQGRSGGLGTSGAALREQRRVEKRKTDKKARETVKSNEKLARQIGKEWAAEKGRKKYENLVLAQCVKKSPLAAALHTALATGAKLKVK